MRAMLPKGLFTAGHFNQSQYETAVGNGLQTPATNRMAKPFMHQTQLIFTQISISLFLFLLIQTKR